MVDRFVTAPVELPPADAEFARADLAFYGVDHSGASFEARVYLGAPEATIATSRDDPSYAGAFHIFGHGGCFGDTGHCDVPTEAADPFDLRPPHQLTPQTKIVTITDALRRVLESGGETSMIVTVIAETLGDRPNDVLAFDRLRLLVYK